MSSETTAKYDEDTLVRMLRDRNQQAVRYLADRYSAALFGVIYRILPNREKAEELLQDAFVKAWNNIGSFQPSKGRLYTWLLTISRNLALDAVRSSGFKRETQTVGLENAVHNAGEEPDKHLFDLKSLSERLRPEQKELIDLLYFQGYTQEEAARKLRIPLGTVKTRVRAAVSELRKFFKLI